ncbi:MAG: DNA gyrase inhibitor YacG [Burkholderiales bacterium]
MSRAKVVGCPSCGTQVEWGPQSPFRPFCSKRCKLLDFGAWATERYRVTGPDHDPNAVDDESAPKSDAR